MWHAIDHEPARNPLALRRRLHDLDRQDEATSEKLRQLVHEQRQVRIEKAKIRRQLFGVVAASDLPPVEDDHDQTRPTWDIPWFRWMQL